MTSFLTFTASGPASGAEIWAGLGDSTTDGLGPAAPYGREVGTDTDWPNVFQIKSTGAISSDTTPLDTIAFTNGGNDRFSWMEYFGKRRQELTGKNIYIIQCAVGGAHYSATGGDSWGPGNPLNVAAIAKINAGIATILAADPTAVFMGFAEEGGSNDGADASSDYEPFVTDYNDTVDDLMSNIFMNGVSGTTAAAANALFLIVAQSADGHLQLLDGYLGVDWVRRDTMLRLPGGRYYFPSTAGWGDLHWFATGVRGVGTEAAEMIESAVYPSFSVVSTYSIPANGPYIQELIATDSDNWYITGADAAQFEIARERVNPIGSGYNGGRTRHFIQWAGGVTHASGTYNVTVNCKGGNGLVTSHAVTVTCGVPPYTTPDVIVGGTGYTLAGWFLASDLANVNISTWPNKAGTSVMSDAGQATSGLRPAKTATSYNSAKPGVTFDGSDDFLQGTITGAPTGGVWSTIVAWQQLSGGEAEGRVFSLNTSSGNDYDSGKYIPMLSNAGNITDDVAGFDRCSVSAPVNEAHVYTTSPSVDGAIAISRVYRDSVAGTSGSAYVWSSGFVPTVYTIGGSQTGDNSHGVMAGMLNIYGTKELPRALRTMLESYMRTLA